MGPRSGIKEKKEWQRETELGSRVVFLPPVRFDGLGGVLLLVVKGV